jgi:hypothetical protein
MARHRPIHRPSTLAAAVLLAGGAASFVTANVSVNIWNGVSSFHHARVGVPDLDQRRSGLPNDGNCFCVPTSFVNMAIYVANHGYPEVEPGEGSFLGNQQYAALTNLLETIGDEAGISPGGGDPNDPDCPGFDGVAGDGGDGECSNLPCGGRVQYVHGAYIDLDLYGGALDDLVFNAKWLDPIALPSSHSVFAQFAFDGGILLLGYGRYAQVGDVSGIPVYKRSGGHCVTMNGILREGNLRTISVRDPAQDDGDLLNQSPWVTKTYDITEVLILVTAQDPDEGPIDDAAFLQLPAIDEPQEDGVKRLIDSYFSVRPKVGVFWKDFDVVNTLPLAGGFGGYEPTHHTNPPAITFAITDLILDEHGIGWIALRPGSTPASGQLIKKNPVTGETTVLGPSTADQLAMNRFDDLYAINDSPPSIERRRADGAIQATVSITGIPRAIACDDLKDRVLVVVPGTAGFGGSIIAYPRSLGVDGTAPTVFPLGTLVPLGTAMRAAVNPQDGHLWIASASNDVARAFKLPASPGAPLTPVELITGFSDLTCIEFDDSGRLYAVDAGSAKVFERDAAGGWVMIKSTQLAGVDVGKTLRISKSRSNFDPARHDTPAWNNIPPAELEELGTDQPDCVGDLNGDGTVDAVDLTVLLGQWGGAGNADLDQNGAVDAADLASLLAAWGPC